MAAPKASALDPKAEAPQDGAVNRNNYDRAYKPGLEEGFWLFEAGHRQ